MKVQLDTCTFLWLAQQPAMLSQLAVAIINDAANELLVSDVSLWEICLKHTAGKLPLPATPRLWIPGKLAFHQIQSLPLTHAAIFRSSDLPRVHADPFDRLLVAQALEEAIPILSPDLPLSTLGVSRIW